MVRAVRLGILGFVLAVGCPSATAPLAVAAQQQKPTSLQLHRWKFRVDDNDHTFLWVQLANTGSKPVEIAGIAVQQRGPWLPVNQKLQPEASIRGQIRIGNEAPKALWVSCSEGLLHFDLPTR
jgi:hypothetical protein